MRVSSQKCLLTNADKNKQGADEVTAVAYEKAACSLLFSTRGMLGIHVVLEILSVEVCLWTVLAWMISDRLVIIRPTLAGLLMRTMIPFG